MGISFDEYIRKKLKDEDDDKKETSKSKISSQNASQSTGKTGRSFDEYVYENYTADKVGSATVQRWFADADSLLKSTQDYVRNNQDKYNVGYGSEYTSKVSSLLDTSDAISAFIKYNKDGFEDYDSISKAFDQYTKYLREFNTHSSSLREYYSQWDSEDAYKQAIASQKEYEELTTLDLDALSKEIEALKSGDPRKQAEYITKSNNIENLRVQIVDLEREIQNNAYVATFNPNERAKQEERENRLASWKAALEREKTNLSGISTTYDSKLSDLTQRYNRAKYIQNGIKLTNDALSAGDFAEKSGYVSTKVDKSKLGWWDSVNTNAYDSTYEYINNVDGMRREIESAYETTYTENGIAVPSTDSSPYLEKGYHLLTDDEVAIYNYYYSTGGKEKAEEYLSSIQETLYSRRAKEMFAGMEDKPFLEYIFGVEAGLDQFASGMKNAFNFKDDYIPVNATQQASSMVREDLADKGFNVWYNFKTGEWEDKIFGSSVGQVGYDSITTTTNMIPSILTATAANFVVPGSGAIVGAGMMGTSAAGNAYQEMLNLGYDKGQARTYSTLVGISEASLQYALGGVSKLGGKLTSNVISKVIGGIDNAFARFAIELGGSVLSEGIEEGLQEIINPLLKNAVLHADEDIDWEQVAYSALLGSLSAFGLEGPGVIANNVSRSITAGIEGKSIVNNGGVESLIALANEMAGVSEEYGVDLSKRVGRVNGKKGVNSKAVGYLSMAMNDVRVQQNKADIVKALESKGISSRKAQRYADILASNNYELGTVEEWQNATGDADSYNVIRSVMDSSVDTRNAKYGRARVGVKTAEDGTISLTEEKAKKVEEAILGSKYAEEADSIEATVSKDGKAKVISTDTEVTLQGIDHIETEQVDGKETDVVYLKVADADGTESTVAWGDVEFANRTEAVLYESFVNMGLDPAHFDAYIKNFNEADFDTSIGEAAIQYAHGFANAYRYGWANLESEVGSDVFASKLTETARNIAYTIGKEAVTNNTEAKQAALDIAVEARKASGKGKSRTKGKFHMADSIKTKPKKNFTRMQQAGIGLAKRISELGIDVYLYESQYVNGQYVDENGEIAANGFFRAKDGSIHIDINAGDRGQGLMTFAIAHELVHYMRVHSPKKFKAFADLLFKWYGEKGKSVNELIEQRMAEENLSWDDAYEEVVARSCESFLTDSNIADRIIELQQTDKGLWETIRDKVLEFLDWMKSLFKDVDVESEEGRFVREFKGEIDHLYDAFYNTLADAVETHQWVGSIAEAKTNAETLATAGITVDTDTGSAVMNSVRYAPQTQAEVDKVAKALSEALGVSIEKAKAWVKSETSLASIVLDPANAMFLDYEVDDRYEAIKNNSDYPQGTVDFSNLCKKRREFTALLDKLQKEHPNRIITAAEMEQIRQILIDENVEVACGLCYVEERRQLLGEIAQGFIDGYKGGTLKSNIAKVLDASDTYVPTIYDLITYDGYRALTKEHPTIAEAFKKFNNARGMQTGRLIEGLAEYKREILNWSNDNVAFVNSVGGLRVFSFSDFEATHLIDLVQVIQDCAVKGVMIQAYTKVPAFANVVKDTNVKLNRSLIAKGTGVRYEDGRMVLDLDPVEGIDINDKDFFDSTDSDNIGNVLVGMSDEQIRLAMRSPFVDYIIPFHSKLPKEILEAKGIGHWSNYLTSQTDKEFHPEKITYKKDGSIKTDGWVKAENQINVYVDVIQAAEAEGKPIRNKVDFVNKFLAVAKERGLKPRFWQFLDVDANGEYVYTEGYHKFLVDFKLFDKDGNILPQKPVVPVFDDALNARILSEYVAGKKAPVSRDAVYDRLEREVINGEGVKKSSRKAVATYTEAQYNAFGWASYNGVITAKERQVLFSRYADFKHNRNKYPVTIWGEAVIHSTECPDVIMYVKGSIESPDVTRIVRIKADDGADISAIQERIVANEFEQKPLPYESVEYYYGEEYLEFHRKQDYASFRQYQDSIREGRGSQESDSSGEGLQDGGRSGRSGVEGNRTDDRRVKKSSRRDSTGRTLTAMEMEDRIFELRDEIEDITEQMEWLDYDDPEYKPLNNALFKARHELDKLVEEERRASVKTPLNEIISNLSKYRISDLYSIAEQFSDSAWDDYEELSRDELESILHESLSMLLKEYDDYYLYVRPVEEKQSKIISFPARASAVGNALAEEFKDIQDFVGIATEYKDFKAWVEAEGAEKFAEEIVAAWGTDGTASAYFQKLLDSKEHTDNEDLVKFVADVIREHIQGKDSNIRYSRRGYAKVGSKAVMTADRIDYLIEDSGAGSRVDYAQSWITSISPTDFLNMTLTHELQDRSAFDKFPSEWNDDATMDTYDYTGELKRNKRQTPYLAIDISTGKVVGHEGRHRIRALERQGIESVEIRVEFRDEDGRIVKYSPDGERLQIKDTVTIANQFGTGQTASIQDVIPLNEDYRDTILANYGEATSTSDDDIRYSKRVIPTGIELPDGTKVDKDGKPRSAQAQRDAGYMLSESKFYQLYSAHKLNFGIKSRGWDLDYVIENIRRNGFISTTSIGNVVPSSLARHFRYDASGNVMFEHIVQQRYAPRKGDTVMFVPNNYVGKYDIIKNGFKPLDYEIAVVEYDYQPYYELYTRAYDSAYEKANGGIRYQRRGTGMSNRSILADALESATQNESEARRLAEYKAKIDLINAEEEKLREVRARIAELSFASGPKDTATIKRLQETATRIASRINTYDKQLLRLEATAPLMALLEREKAAARKREKERGREILGRYRERIRTSGVRRQIKAYKAKLERTLLNPTDGQYVPIDLIRAMIDVCDLIDTDTDLYKKNGEINKAQVKRNLTKERLQALRNEYENLKTNSDPVYAGEFDEMVYDYIKELSDKFGGKNLNDMSLDELTEMYSILRAIGETLQDAKKLIGWADAESVYEAGDAIVAEQNAITRKRKKGKRSATQKAGDAIDNYSLSPVRNVEKMSGYNEGSYLRRLFTELEKGIRKKNKFVMESYKSFEHLTSGNEYDDAVYKPYGNEYTDVNGRKFRVSKMQMMQAILSHDREVANGMSHIQGSGFTFADLDMLRRGRLKDAVSEEYSHRVPSATWMVEEFREALKEDKWCQEYMKVARAFFDGKAKDAINETSIAWKHRVIASDKAYIPFEVDRNFVVLEISADNDIQQTINSYGSLKSTKDGASQPLIITGLNNILERHIEQVGNVYGLAIPVRNFNKVWNVRTMDATGNDPTVKAVIERNWGKGGVELIQQAVKDIQSPRPNTQSAFYKFVKGGYISSTFVLNLSVVSKQIGSMFSARSMLKWRSTPQMLGNLLYTMVAQKKISAEVDKYTASAWMRRQGMSDAELHTLSTMAKKPGLLRWLSKAPTIINPVKWITAMDHAVALSLWRYAKIDTAKKTGLKGEELLKATAEFYDEVVENTQSMTDVLHRPEVQKKGDVISEGLGMFKTDLFQMAGRLKTTAGRFGANKTKENALALGRTVYAVFSSALWASAMTAVFAMLRYKVNQYRDDEDEELTLESWLKRLSFSFSGDIVGYLVPLFGSEAVDAIEALAYGEINAEAIDNIALSAINDLYSSILNVVNATTDFAEGGKTEKEQKEKQDKLLESLDTLIMQTLQVFKIPANNISRIINAVKLHAEDIANGEFLSFEAGVDRSTANEIHRITELIEAEEYDEAKSLFDEIVEDMAMEKADGGEYGKEELDEAKSSLKTALGNKYKDGEIDKATAEYVLRNLFGMDSEEIYWLFDKWEYAIEDESGEDYAKYDAFVSAVKNGGNVAAEIRRYTENGVEMDSLKTALSSAYVRGELGKSSVENALSKHFDMDDNEIYWAFDRWDYAKQNGSSEGYSKYGEFYTAVESGKNLKATIKRYTDHGVEAKTLASQITSHFKPLYKEMSNAERANLKGYLLNAYALLGYNRLDKSKDIDKWLKD